MKTKRTELTKHYWNNEGAYEQEFSQLTNELMPSTGRAEYLVGEVVRAANRLYYEYCNNGNMNARDIVELYDDDYEVELSEFYGAFINIIRDALDRDGDEDGVNVMDSIEAFIIEDNPDRREYFSDEHMHTYDLMIDYVAEYALRHKDDKTAIPANYKG